jgi:hypothetical protein
MSDNIETVTAETPTPEAVTTETSTTLLGAPEPAPAPVPFSVASLTLPENYVVPDELGAKLTAMATEHNLPLPVMQSLADLHIGLVEEARTAIAEAVEITDTARRDAYQSAVVAHYGADLEAAIARVKNVTKEFGGPEFVAMLEETGAGSHLGMFAFLEKIAKVVGEGTPVSLGAQPTGEVSALQKMYPSYYAKKG